MATRKTQPKATKTTKPKTVAKPAQADGSRYYRAAKAIIASGDGDNIDPMRLVADARLSLSSSRYCIEAYKGIVTALREAGRLPDKPAPAKRAPAASTKGRRSPESAAAGIAEQAATSSVQ
jgi:hypothetical protein